MQERFHNFGIHPNWGSGVWPLMRDYLNARLPPLWCSVSCPDWRAGPYPILGLALIVNPARFAVSRDLGVMRHLANRPHPRYSVDHFYIYRKDQRLCPM